MISSSVAFLRQEGLKVHVDLEHFYDGSGDERRTATKNTVECARPRSRRARGGRFVRHERRSFTVGRRTGHGRRRGRRPFRNMRGSTRTATGRGGRQFVSCSKRRRLLVQGTANGVGERTGNANLTLLLARLL